MYKYEVGRGHKTGIYLNCPQCSNDFYITKSLIGKSKSHCCSLKCSAKFTAQQRAEKLRKKNYPFVAGKCILCRKDIIVKNAKFDKPNRKFCSKSCRCSFSNSKRIWKQISKDKISKANSKGGITPENHKIRTSIEFRLWREAVFARDNWTCQKYGIKGGKLHPHHIQNFAQITGLRFEIDNGITLSAKAHIEFHKKYGYKNNTREQLKEYLKVV